MCKGTRGYSPGCKLEMVHDSEGDEENEDGDDEPGADDRDDEAGEDQDIEFEK